VLNRYVKLWVNELLIDELALLSEKEEFTCTHDGVRISWIDGVVIAPPFFSIVDKEYGIFQRTADGALIMKRSDTNLIFMWGFIPWLTDVGSQWVKWQPYENNHAREDKKTDDGNNVELLPESDIRRRTITAGPEPGEAQIYFYQDSTISGEGCLKQLTLLSSDNPLGRSSSSHYSIVFVSQGLFEFIIDHSPWKRVILEEAETYYIRAMWEKSKGKCVLDIGLVSEEQGHAAISDRFVMDVTRYRHD
jgi:hypothetical protein